MAEATRPGHEASTSPSGATNPRSSRHAGTPHAIAFWDARHGLIGIGAPRHCSGAVSTTANGGRSFRVSLRTPGSVESLAVAGRWDAWALVRRCGRVGGHARRSRLLHTGDGGRSWHRLPPSRAANPSFATPRRGLAVASPGTAKGGIASGSGLLATSDGGRSWRPLPGPCPHSRRYFGEGEAVAWPAPAHAWALCVGQPTVGLQGKAIFASTDGGRGWHTLVSIDLEHRRSVAGLSLGGYPQGLSFSPSGLGLLWEDRGYLYLTRDGGHRWRRLDLIRPEVDSGISADALSRDRAFFLRLRGVIHGVNRLDLLRTQDAGRSWTVVHRWPVR